MKAIEINGEIKTYNDIPKTWNNTMGYNYQHPTVWEADGFKDVVEPTYNSTTQYKGSLIYDEANNVFTYQVIDFTPEQLATNLAIVEDSEDKTDIEKLVNRGGNLVTKTKERLVRRRKKGLITKARTKTVREILHPIFLLLNTGDIDIANDKAILIPVNANGVIETELSWFKNEIASLLTDVNNLL